MNRLHLPHLSLLKTVFFCCYLAIGFGVSGQTLPPQLEGRERIVYLIDKAYDFYSADFATADSIFTEAATEAQQNEWTS